MRVEAAPGLWISLPDDATDAEIQQAADDAVASRKSKPLPLKPQPALPTPTQAAASAGTRGLVSSLQGPTFGFADEALGALGAIGSMTGTALAGGDVPSLPDAYRMQRDRLRAMEERQKQEYPILTGATQLAASAPTLALGGGATFGIKGTGALASAGRGAASGGLFGSLAGIGESEGDTVQDVAIDALKGGAISAGTGGLFPIIGAGVRKITPEKIGEGARSIGSAIDVSVGTRAGKRAAAENYAKEKVLQSLIRDMPGQKLTGEEAVRRGVAMGEAIGPDARIIDVGSKNTRGLMDVVSSLPGRTGTAAERLIRERQASQGREISRAAERLILGRKSDYADDLAAAEKARSEIAAPLYAQLEGVKFTVDDELASLLSRAEAHVKEAMGRAKIRGEPEELTGDVLGKDVSLQSLNTLKSTLWDAAQNLKADRKSGAASELLELRFALKNKIDELSPKDEEGRSIARMADDLWGGAEQYRSAIEAGRKAMSMDDINLAQEMRGMTSAELEGFQIGLVQSIKSMAGTTAGRNKLLAQWKNDTTGNKLRLAFGGKFKDFEKVLASVEKKKGLEQAAGRGSQTMPRTAAMGDLDQSATMAQEVAQISQAPHLSLLDRIVGQAKTPEPVRDEIGRLMMKPTSELTSLLDIAAKVNEARAQRAAKAGMFTGVGLLPIFQ